MKMVFSFAISLVLTGQVNVMSSPLVITQFGNGLITAVQNGVITNTPPPVTNNTVFAASTSFVDVSNAVAAAQCGWTVQLPAGTNGWYNTLNISGVTLKGMGTNQTMILDEMPIVGGGNGTPFLVLNTVSCAPTRITGIRFSGGVTNNITNFPNNFGPNIQIDGSASNWRVDNCQFVYLSGKTMEQFGDVYGVVDHCNFLTYTRIALEIFGQGPWGDADWASPITFGSSNATYMENNYFRDTVDNFCGWVDVSGGGRVVFRYNNCNNYYVNTHGAETTQRFRSSRYVEIYMNTFTYETNSNFQNFYTVCDIRGGTGIIWSNQAYGYYAVGSLNNYRSADNDPGFTPWYGATGLTNWDGNGSQLASGHAGMASTSNLIDTNASWTVNQWVGATVYNYRSTLIGCVTANNSTNITFAGSRHSQFQIGFNSGDNYTIHRIYPMFDAPGVGTGDLLVDQGSNPTPVFLNETAAPVYGWANNRWQNGSPGTTFFVTTNGIGTGYSCILPGRDFTNSFKVGYVPYTYPHPATLN